MKSRSLLYAMVLVVFVGCKHDPGTFEGHTLGETFSHFTESEHPTTSAPDVATFTGTIHCYSSDDIGDHCKVNSENFDNAHFTFVDGKLVSIESVGAGGIVGNPKQNWNWNLYLSRLTKQYGKPTQMTATEALWLHHAYALHASLQFEHRFDFEAQDEHFIMQTRESYDRSK